MTVSNQTNRIAAVGSGATGQEVPFLFPITATSDLLVKKRVTATGVETTLDETTNYTVEISGDIGGTLTTVTVIETTEQIHIIRNTPNTQSLDLVAGGSFSPENIEDALDKNMKVGIENKDAIGKAIIFPATDAASLTTELPSSIDRASKNLTFDSDGNVTASVSVEEGNVSFTTFGTNMAEAANALAAKTVMNLDHMLDVRDYGTVGDGSTDDTAAINLATTTANTAGGGIVYIPAGSYKLTDSLVLHSNTTLIMDPNAILLRYFSGAAAVVGFSAKNGTIRNATKDVAARDSHITIIGGQIYANNVSYVGNHVMMWGVDDFRIENVRIRQAYGNDQGMIYRGDRAIFSNLNMNLISDTNTEATPNDGIHIASGTNIRIDNCYIKTEDDSISLANYNDDGNSAISDVVISNCNLVSNRNNIKISHSWDVTGLIQRVAITNCIGYQTGAGGAHLAQNVTILPENGSSDSKIKDITISNSIFRQAAFAGHATYNSHAVFVKGSDNVFLSNVWTVTPNRTGFWVQDCDNVQIRGGGILSPRNSGHPCIQLFTVNDVLIEGAYIYEPTTAQNVLINDVCDNIKIINCNIKEIASGSAGIATNALSTVDGLIMTGNTFGMASTTGYGYQAAGDESNIIFANNDCRGVTLGIKDIGEVNAELIVHDNLGYAIIRPQIVCNENQVVCNENQVVRN